ncbi:thermonuclease family protein [Mycoplasma sp. 394]
MSKFTKLIKMIALPTLSASSLVAAVACSKYDPANDEKLPILEYKVDASVSKYPLIFTEDKKDYHYNITTTPEVLNNTLKRTSFYNDIDKIKEKIASSIQNQFKQQIHLTFLQPQKAVLRIDDAKSSYPKLVRMKFFDKYVVFKFLYASVSLNLDDKPKEPGQNNPLSQWDSKSIKDKITLGYQMFYQNHPVDWVSVVNIEKPFSFDVPIKDMKVDTDEKNFVPLGIDFNQERFKNKILRAKLVSDSDGDTFTIEPLEAKIIGNAEFKIGEQYKIRLRGIDTPEKGIGGGKNYKTASPFESHFAYKSTEFAEKIFNKYKDDVLVAFPSGKDTYGRNVADIIFGSNDSSQPINDYSKYKYSYGVEIIRAGLTLPLSEAAWSVDFKQAKTDDFIYNIYPKMAQAADQAVAEQNGFFKYFDTPDQVSLYVYLSKRPNSYAPFYSSEPGDASNKVKTYTNQK